MTNEDARWELLSICEMQCDDARCEDCFVKVATEAIEKQVPKKPIYLRDGYHCPTCEHYIELGHRCHNNECGQAIDWGEEVKE